DDPRALLPAAHLRRPLLHIRGRRHLHLLTLGDHSQVLLPASARHPHHEHRRPCRRTLQGHRSDRRTIPALGRPPAAGDVDPPRRQCRRVLDRGTLRPPVLDRHARSAGAADVHQHGTHPHLPEPLRWDQRLGAGRPRVLFGQLLREPHPLQPYRSGPAVAGSARGRGSGLISTFVATVTRRPSWTVLEQDKLQWSSAWKLPLAFCLVWGLLSLLTIPMQMSMSGSAEAAMIFGG